MKRIVTVVIAVMLAVLAIVPVTAACAEASGTKMYVSSSNGKGVRMRADASTSAAVLDQLNEGTVVTVLAYVGTDWACVKAEGRTKNGFVMRKFLSDTDPATLDQTFTAVKVRTVTVKPVSGSTASLLTAASKSASSAAVLNRGDKLTVTAESRAFYAVTDANGRIGYVAKSCVK